jgi:hypothetical protein
MKQLDGASPKASKLNCFTFTNEKIQNQCISILLMTFYFDFKWLFVNVKLNTKDVNKIHTIGKDHGSSKMFIWILYFPTLNINTYICIIGVTFLSIFMQWTNVMCFMM